MNPTPDVRSATPARSLIIPSDLVPANAGLVGFLGSQTRRGDWLLPRLFRVVSVLGNVEIDLTRARVGPGKSRIEVRVLFGNVEILVPPEFRIECDGSAILANFATEGKMQSVLSEEAPLISIGGSAFAGNVEVKVVDPNAPDWIDRIAARFKR